MKLIHTADWHIGQTFYGYDRTEEHLFFFSQLRSIIREEHPDLLVISGDIYDTATPSASAMRLFNEQLALIKSEHNDLQIILVAGNHDSPSRLEASSPLLQLIQTDVIGYVKKKEGEIDLDSLLIPIRKKNEVIGWCIALPFLRRGDVNKEDDECESEALQRLFGQLMNRLNAMRKPHQPIVMTGHLTLSGSQLSEEEQKHYMTGGLESISSQIYPAEVAYVALGHIHKAQRVAGPTTIRYAGSPFSLSFAERNYRHSVAVVAMGNGELSEVRLRPLESLYPLYLIPNEPMLLEEVIRQLDEIPDDRKGYLQVNVLLTELIPDLKNRIVERLQNKQIRLATISASFAEKASDETLTVHHVAELRRIDPVELAKDVYQKKYHGNEMPEDLIVLFKRALSDIQTNE